MHKYLLVGVGGFFGSATRYVVDSYVAATFGLRFPLGTLAVNASGSLLLGFLFAAFLERLTHNHGLSLLLAYGFIGAYTTFSTFMLDSVKLANEGGPALAAVNVAVSLAIGLAAVYLGLALGRTLA